MVFEKYPHRTVDEILDELLTKVEDFGEAIMTKVDDILTPDGPHRSIDAIIDGVIEGVKRIGEGIAEALDKPLNFLTRRI